MVFSMYCMAYDEGRVFISFLTHDTESVNEVLSGTMDWVE